MPDLEMLTTDLSGTIFTRFPGSARKQPPFSPSFVAGGELAQRISRFESLSELPKGTTSLGYAKKFYLNAPHPHFFWVADHQYSLCCFHIIPLLGRLNPFPQEYLSEMLFLCHQSFFHQFIFLTALFDFDTSLNPVQRKGLHHGIQCPRPARYRPDSLLQWYRKIYICASLVLLNSLMIRFRSQRHQDGPLTRPTARLERCQYCATCSMVASSCEVFAPSIS